MTLDFTALLAPAAWTMAALVVLPVALFTLAAFHAPRAGSRTARATPAARRREREAARPAFPSRIVRA